jgi:hypothetical protein
MKYGPTSAAISAMMKAMANPSSVVCTVSPLEHAPAQLACAAWRRPFALALPAIAMTIRKSHPPPRGNQGRNNDIYRDKSGEVTATSCDSTLGAVTSWRAGA